MRAIALLGLLAGCPSPEDSDTDAPTDELTDPLSMPATPTLDPADFGTAASCADCHPVQVAAWSRSNHAYAVVDPVFQALVAVRQADYDGAQDRFCMQCHTAIGVRGGEVVPGFSFDALSPIAREGVTCEACHKVAALERDHNSGHVLDPTGPLRGPFDAASPHASERTDLLASSEFCAGCHDVIEVSGLPLERPYEEWLASPAPGADLDCQGCHMPVGSGPAALDGPDRTLRDHRFVGVDVPLADGFVDEPTRDRIAEDVAALLDGAATLDLTAPDTVRAGERFDVTVDVQNLVEGHSLPTGSTFLRQVWIEVVVAEADGDVVYETGTLDADGDLRDAWSELDRYGDADLITLSSTLIDARGEPVLFPWRAVDHVSHAIPPGYARTWTLHVQAGDAGPLTVTARLRLRPVGPFLLRALGLGAHVDQVRTFDLADDVRVVEVR